MKGSGHSKIRHFQDFLDVSVSLVSEGIANNLMAYGQGPSGGLTVSTVISKEPELYTAAVLRNPLIDVLHFQRQSLPSSELGSLDSKEDFDRLLSYSPFHQQIKKLSTSVLVTSDDPYFSVQAIKFVSKLRTTDLAASVLFKEFERWEDPAFKRAEEFAFLVDRGLRVGRALTKP
mmetsp:Transcript_25510/g.44450  ORF Transcript_25510/g.44450 Transcript_25510/m.44450 type:complete len:175 (-) Transcript_25510:173-697(-)